MSTLPSSSSSSTSSQFTYSNGSYFPTPFHSQQPQYAAPPQPPLPASVPVIPAAASAVVPTYPAAPGVYTLPQFQKEMEGTPIESEKQMASVSASQAQSEDHEIKARVDAVWQKMSKGVSSKTLQSIVNKRSSTGNKTPQTDKVSNNWMSILGLGPKKTEVIRVSSEGKSSASAQNGTSDEAKKLAAAALAAARDATAACALNRGKIEVTEVRDFAGEMIEVKKLIDPSSKEAAERAQAHAGPSSAVDSVLEQIKKKPKLNLLDKTKKDWGEFKGENKDYEEELDAYKKSSNQYLDKVSFLSRADYREFERERDARLAQQAKRKTDMREGP